jgi:integrase
MAGEIQVFRYTTRPSWYFRSWSKDKRRYVVRSLRTDDRDTAINRAIEQWKVLVPLIQAGVPTDVPSITGLVHQYLQDEQARVDAGEVMAGMLRDKRTQLKTFLIYCKIQGLKRLSDIHVQSLDGFVEWRRDKSQMITNGRNERLKRGSLNKSIREVRAFWKYLRKKRLVDFDINLMEVSTRHEEERTRNVAYTQDDWAAIEGELLRLSKETHGIRGLLQPGQRYWRTLFKTLLQTLVHSGLRPNEATRLLQWKDIKYLDEGKTKEERTYSSECTLNVRNPRGKGSRVVACDAGLFLKLWMVYVSEWRRENGHAPLQRSDQVFGNPGTGNEYPYSQFGNYFRKVLSDLGLAGMGYTIRSSRAFYVTRLLAAGHSPYLISKNCGHDLRVMRANYEQLSAEDLINEFLRTDT